jgi:hypothetical protein
MAELLRSVCNIIFIFHYSGGQKGYDKVLPDPLQKGMSTLYCSCSSGVTLAAAASRGFILLASDHRQVWGTGRI